MKPRRTFWRTTIIGWGLLAFLAGLMLAKAVSYEPSVYGVFPLLGLLFVFRKRTIATLVLACLVGLLLGLWRGQTVRTQVATYQDWYGRVVTVKGTVLDDPVYDDQGRLDFRIGAVKIEGDAALGQVRVKGFINGLMRGDRIVLSSRLGV